jgi:hypothetical protein
MSNFNQDVRRGGQGRGLRIGREAEDSEGNPSLAVGPGPHGRRGQLRRAICWHHSGDHSNIRGILCGYELENANSEVTERAQQKLCNAVFEGLKACTHLYQQDNMAECGTHRGHCVFVPLPRDSKVLGIASDWLESALRE